jgi:Trk-type K+ transport system membrane component
MRHKACRAGEAYVSNYDRELQHKLRTLESIEAHLRQHDKTVRRGLIWLSALGIMVLALLVYVITRLSRDERQLARPGRVPV